MYQVGLLVIFLYFEATRLASKAVVEAAINDLSPPNLPSSITNKLCGNKIVQTLEKIVEELKLSNQKVRSEEVVF